MATIKDLQDIMKFLSDTAISRAASQAINRTVLGLRTLLNEKIREKRKLKVSEINEDYLRMRTAKTGEGTPIDDIAATLTLKDKKISLIRFALGNKLPANQLGVKIARRKPVRVEIIPGKRSELRSGPSRKAGFIAKGKSGNVHVFVRTTTKSSPIIPKKVESLARTKSIADQYDTLLKYTQDRFNKEFQHNLLRELKKVFKQK